MDKKGYIESIDDFLEKVLFPPLKKWPEWNFRKRSIERAAVFYILSKIKKSSDDPKKIIYSSIIFFDEKIEESDNQKIIECLIFAREISKELYYLFC